MSGTQPTVEQLIRELLDLEEISIVNHSGLFWMIIYGKHGPAEEYSMGEDTDWLRVGSEHWQFYTRPGAIQRVRFVRGPTHAPGREEGEPPRMLEGPLAAGLR